MSRSKRNQAIKFGQLIEYSIKIIFLKKSCTKYGGETGPRPFFLKKTNLSISLNQQSEVSYSLFFLFVQVKDYQNILKLRC